MKKSIVLLLVLSLLSSCGKNSTGGGGGKDPIEGMGEAIAGLMVCATVGIFTGMADSLSADYDVKLYRRTVDRVRSEIKKKKKFKAANFWSSLTPATRQILNHELNLILNKDRSAAPLDVYKATALYFSSVRKKFQPTIDYKIKDAASNIYSFTIRAQDTNSVTLLGSNCATGKGTNMDFVKIPHEVLLSSEIQEIYECKYEAGSFLLMEIRDQAQLYAGKKLYAAPLSELIKNDTEKLRKLFLGLPGASVSVVINKKKDFVVRDWPGKKSEIVLKTPDLFVDEVGACEPLLHGL